MCVLCCGVVCSFAASGDHCADPGLPANGLRTGKKPFVVGSVVLYSCYGGYAMQGASSQQCQEDGMWSGARPDCVKGRSN